MQNTTSSNDAREFDVLVYGATGFTGALIAEHLALTYGVQGSPRGTSLYSAPLRWGIAGRDAGKLERVARELSASLDAPTSSIACVVADAHDLDALRALTSRTAVVVSAAGPFCKHGADLIAACIETGTHYCNITGEAFWVRAMVDQHQARAQERGVWLVPFCGFDSIPSDLGTLLAQETCRARHGAYAPSVSMRVEHMANASLSGGTFATMVSGYELTAHDPEARRALIDVGVLASAVSGASVASESVLAARREPGFGWVGAYMMAAVNEPVVQWSHALAGSPYGRPFRYGEGMSFGKGAPGWFMATVASWVGRQSHRLLSFAPTRAAFARLAPQPGEGPSRARRESASWSLRFQAEPADRIHAPVVVRVRGDSDPGYSNTPRMAGEAAVALARGEVREGLAGGFWTPALAFGLPLTDRLARHAGVTFHVVDDAER